MLFDALGTLVELEPPVPRLREELSRQARLEVSEAEAERALAAEISYYRAHLGEGHDAESLARLRRKCTEVLREALPERAHATELEPLQTILLDALRFRAFPDAAAAIAAMRRLGARVGVVSNWDISLEQVLRRVGLAPALEGVITSAGAGARKPDPRIFARALELLGAQAARTVHVGDSLAEDVAGARAAGISPILLRRDGAPGPPGVTTIANLELLGGALAVPPASQS